LTSLRRAGIAALVVAAVAVVVIVVAVGSGRGGDGAGAQAASTSTATTPIRRQDLVEVDTESGTLGYADRRTVINHLSGTVTWLAAQGSVVRAGHALFKVDGSPVILLSGELPAYRTLQAGVSDGADIRQLERNLRALGYDPYGQVTVDRHWTVQTTAAVERWQAAHELEQTGVIELGRVVFQPGSRRVASTSVALGASASGGGGGGGASGGSSQQTSTAAGQDSGVRTQLASLVTGAKAVEADRPIAVAAAAGDADTTTTPDGAADAGTVPAPAPATTPADTTTTTPSPATPPATSTPGPPSPPPATVPTPVAKRRTTKAKTAPSRSASSTARSGSSTLGGGSARSDGGGASAAAVQAATRAAAGTGGTSGPATAIMTTTSTRRVVTVALPTTNAALARAGERVSVELPSGDTVHGRIASVGTVATSSSSTSDAGGGGSSSGPATITVTIRLFSRGTALDQAPVTVRFERNRVKDALAIPVTALIATAGGGFAVEVVESAARRLVRVTTGLYTSGFVQITGPGLRPGMRVTNAAL
jgi:hypothetical protein